MPYCSQCGSEYRPGIVTCPDCDIALIQGERLICGVCREDVDREASFCAECGSVLPWARERLPRLVCAVHRDTDATGECVICHRHLCGVCARVRNGRMFCNDDEHVKAAFNWVVACTTGTEQEAEMIKANLEGAGIGAFVFPQRDSMYVTTMGNLAVVEVMVPKESLAEARQYLQSLEAGEPPTPSAS